MIAPPARGHRCSPPAQIVEGYRAQADSARARRRLGCLSQAIAEEHHLHVGEALRCPTPDPTRFRVAALSTNIGWAPGAVTMTADEYARAWGSSDASAYNILLAPGASPATVAAEIRRTLGPTLGSGRAERRRARGRTERARAARAFSV